MRPSRGVPLISLTPRRDARLVGCVDTLVLWEGSKGWLPPLRRGDGPASRRPGRSTSMAAPRRGGRWPSRGLEGRGGYGRSAPKGKALPAGGGGGGVLHQCGLPLPTRQPGVATESGLPRCFFLCFFFFSFAVTGRESLRPCRRRGGRSSKCGGGAHSCSRYVCTYGQYTTVLADGGSDGWKSVVNRVKVSAPLPLQPLPHPPPPPPNQLARERPGMHPSISVRKSTAGIGPSGYRGLSSCTWGRCADGTGRTYARSGVATALEPLAPAHVNARRPSPAPANRRRRPWRPSSASWRSRPPPGGVPPARRVNTRCGGRCLRFNKVRTGGFRVRSLTAGALRAPPAHAQRARARPLWRRRRRLGAVDGTMSSSAHLS